MLEERNTMCTKNLTSRKQWLGKCMSRNINDIHELLQFVDLPQE